MVQLMREVVSSSRFPGAAYPVDSKTFGLLREHSASRDEAQNSSRARVDPAERHQRRRKCCAPPGRKLFRTFLDSPFTLSCRRPRVARNSMKRGTATTTETRSRRIVSMNLKADESLKTRASQHRRETLRAFGRYVTERQQVQKTKWWKNFRSEDISEFQPGVARYSRGRFPWEIITPRGSAVVPESKDDFQRVLAGEGARVKRKNRVAPLWRKATPVERMERLHIPCAHSPEDELCIYSRHPTRKLPSKRRGRLGRQ